MARNDFIPPGDGDFLAWHDQLTAAAAALAATLGIPAGEITALTTENTACHTDFTASIAAAAAARQATAQKRATRRAAEQHARTLAKGLKLVPAYTEALGQQLGIVGPEDTTDMTTAKPDLKVKELPFGCAELSFKKLKAEGVNFYSQRGSEPGFTFLARDTESPYIDNRPLLVAGQPEVRKYKAVYVLNDAEIGIESDVVEGVCRP